MMSNILGKTGVGAVALGALIALSPVSAEASVIYATEAIIVTDGPRGTADGRDAIENAYGAADGKFFELGYEAVVDFRFGDPFGQLFFGPGSIIEITNGNAANWPEAVKIEVGLSSTGIFQTAAPNPFTNTGPATFTFSGVFDTVRLTDVTEATFPNGGGSNRATGGFDVDSIGVSPVPLPAAGLLLLGGLGGLVAMRRRKRSV